MSLDSQYKDKIDFYLSSLDELGEVLINQEGSTGITKAVLRIILGTMMASKGAIIGNLVISRPNLPTFEIPLLAAENVGSGGFKEKVLSAAKFVLRSISQNPEAAF